MLSGQCRFRHHGCRCEERLAVDRHLRVERAKRMKDQPSFTVKFPSTTVTSGTTPNETGHPSPATNPASSPCR
jgi:hypothetical protein